MLVIGCADDESPSTTSTTQAITSTSVTGPPQPTVPTSWPNRREPCSLLDAETVAEVVGFRVTRGVTADRALGGDNACVWLNEVHGEVGGLVTLTVVPPGTDLAPDEALLSDPTEVAGLPSGVRAVLGHVPDTIGPGTTGAIVTIGDAGFSIVISTYELREAAETERLVRAALDAWGVEPATPE
jgi:hypothetical protein